MNALLTPFSIEYAARSLTGRRNNNEDAWCADAQTGIFTVADGMGGYEGGEIASQLAVKAVEAFYRRNAGDDNNTWPFGLDPALGLEENALSVAIRVADGDVCAHRKGRLASMGTTIAAVAVRGRRAVVGHVGDSRVYRLRGERLVALTRDHSLYEEMREAGMNVGPRERFPHGNVITRALGMARGKGPDIVTHALQDGDVFLLCSDGLTEGLTETRLGELLAERSCEDACDALVSGSYESGARDNITALVLRVRSGAGARAPAGAHEGAR